MTAAIIQARTASTRFPGKILKSLPCDSDISVLQQVIRRVKQVDLIDEIIIAHPDKKSEQPIAQIAQKENVQTFAGNEADVLDRYFQGAKAFNCDEVVRITSDCPCIDPGVIEKVIKTHRKATVDYTSNILERTYPRGMDTEVITFTALEKIHQAATKGSHREHVTAYLHQNKQQFNLKTVKAPTHQQKLELRVTLDTRSDYLMLCTLFDNLYDQDPFFNLDQIVKLVQRKPWIAKINSDSVQKKAYKNRTEEIKAAVHFLELQEMPNAAKVLKKHL
jgi:spore coat polysaccharide biosynthesis protein SpsF